MVFQGREVFTSGIIFFNSVKLLLLELLTCQYKGTKDEKIENLPKIFLLKKFLC